MSAHPVAPKLSSGLDAFGELSVDSSSWVPVRDRVSPQELDASCYLEDIVEIQRGEYDS